MGLSRARIREALDRVAGEDPIMAGAIEAVGYPKPRHRPRGFATLLQIIIAQQISTHAAAAVWDRHCERFGDPPTPGSILAAGEDALREAGLSRQKVCYAIDLASAAERGELGPRRLARMADEAAIDTITRVRGLGRWSAEIYLLFAEGREDIWPADDLAVQIGFQQLHGLDDRPRGKGFYALSEKWAPHRSACALMMWHWYGSATLR